MTDNGDQAALNKLVDDCYGGKWPWEKGDWIEYRSLHRGDAFKVVLYISKDSKGQTQIRPNTPPGYFSEESFNKEFRPLAGTWVEGRLMKKFREILGGQTVSMTIFPSGKSRIETEPGGKLLTFRGDTPIQALCAALRAVREAQKEVSDGTV